MNFMVWNGRWVRSKRSFEEVVSYWNLQNVLRLGITDLAPTD